MHSENFKKCLLKTLRFEAGYVNDPDDPGGETVFGISRKYHPDWPGWKFIDKFPDKQKISLVTLQDNKELFNLVAQFYYEKFYLKIKGPEIEKYLPKLACNVFDFSVNSGVYQSKLFLQKTINKIIKLYELDIKKLKIDGIIGPKTLNTLKFITDLNNSVIKKELICVYKQERVKYYVKITKAKPKFLKYVYGWINRAFEC